MADELKARGVVVKPLRWGKENIARMAFGAYQVERKEEACGVLLMTYGASDDDMIVCFAENEEEAKAAAQADYERRILSAITVQPMDVAEARTCAKCGAPEDNHPYRHPFTPIDLKRAPVTQEKE